MTPEEERVVAAAHEGPDVCRCGMPALFCPNADNIIESAPDSETGEQ